MPRAFIGLVGIPLALLNAQSVSTQDAVSQLVRAHQVWGIRASTPNTELDIRESSRSGNVIRFRLYAKGISKDQIYSIMAWPVTQKQPSESLQGVTLDESGLAICAGSAGTCGTSDKPNDPIDLVTQPAPGEPVRLALISADGATKVFAKVVPVPIRGEDRGCAVEGVLLAPGAALVLVDGSGFPANTELKMESNSEDERHNEKGTVDSEGRYSISIPPHTQGTPQGILKVTLKSARCSPSINIPWGRRSSSTP